MRVAEVVQHKGAKVVTATPDDSVEAVSRILRDAQIGAVVVVGRDGRMVGILSERDIVRGLADQGAALLDKPVSELMTRDVSTCTSEATVQELMEQMVVGRIRHLPVVDGDDLVGIVSVGDIVKNALLELRSVKDTLEDYIARAAYRALDE